MMSNILIKSGPDHRYNGPGLVGTVNGPRDCAGILQTSICSCNQMIQNLNSMGQICYHTS